MSGRTMILNSGDGIVFEREQECRGHGGTGLQSRKSRDGVGFF